MDTTAHVTLRDGTEIRFAPLSVLDVVQHQQELAPQRDQIPEGDDGQGAQTVELVAGLDMIWRAAKRGGFAGTFEDFWSRVRPDEQKEVAEAAAPFLSPDAGSE